MNSLQYTQNKSYLQGRQGILNLETKDLYNLRGFTNTYFKLNEGKTIGFFDIEHNDINMIQLKETLDLLDIPYKCKFGVIKYTNNNLYDFIYRIFNENLPYCNRHLFDSFIQDKCIEGSYKLNDTLAIPPQKTRFTDTGYDLHVVKLEKKIGLTNVYNTCVSVQPPLGYYFDVVPRSSITKMGYFQTNSVGIIDCGYTGNILIGLTKMSENIEDLTLPCKIAQLIPRKLELTVMKETSNVEETSRGTDGGIVR